MLAELLGNLILMCLFHNLVLDVTVELPIGNLVLDCDDTEVVENDVFDIHRNFDFPALSLAECASESKIVVAVDRSVSAAFLLVDNQLLGDDLVLVGDLVELDHELFCEQMTVHLRIRVVA